MRLWVNKETRRIFKGRVFILLKWGSLFSKKKKTKREKEGDHWAIAYRCLAKGRKVKGSPFMRGRGVLKKKGFLTRS